MRISYWSSDVFSSDLYVLGGEPSVNRDTRKMGPPGHVLHRGTLDTHPAELFVGGIQESCADFVHIRNIVDRLEVRAFEKRSEARRVGKECVRTVRSRGSTTQ